MTVTLFKDLFSNKPFYTTVDDVLKKIKTGTKQDDLIKQIRTTPDKEARDSLKKQLGVILFAGKFSERKATGLLQSSRLVVLDFDGLANPVLKKTELSALPYVYAAFISPGGNGVKALVKVASDNYGGHWSALNKEIKGVDPSGKDICRACFMSLDADIYINLHSDIYTSVVELVYTDEQKYDKLKKWLENKGEKFITGNRNNFLAKLAGAMNRFGLSADYAAQVFERDYVTGTDFSSHEARQVVRSIYTNYADVHGSESFDAPIGEAKVVEILSAEIKTRDIITADAVREDLINDYEKGTAGGTTTYFPVLDAHFRWMRGELTAMTGIANAGKSAMLAQLLLCKAVFEGQKFALLSMEQYPPIFFYRELIRSVIGKPLEKGDPHRMSRHEYNRGLDFVNAHFFFIYPERDAATPEWTLARFAEASIKHGVSGVVVDPHNTQAHDYKSAGGRDDKYLAEMLMSYQRFALQNGLYFIDVAHPRGIGKKEDGTYKEPTADEISGGPVWWQRCDNILVFHRPMLPLDYTDVACTLRSAKIKKQQLNGLPGVSEFAYNRKNGRYYELGFNPMEGRAI